MTIYDALTVVGLILIFAVTMYRTAYNKKTPHPKIPEHTMNIAMDIFRFVSGISLIAALIFIILEIVPIAILMVSVLFVICMTSLSI